MNFKIIAAIDNKWGIGFNNILPWKLPNEMKHFQRITKSVVDTNKTNAVIMGKNTLDSMNGIPLKNRRNIVITRSDLSSLSIDCVPSLDIALKNLKNISNIENVFVIGGQQLYEEAINDSRALREPGKHCGTVGDAFVTGDGDFGGNAFEFL